MSGPTEVADLVNAVGLHPSTLRRDDVEQQVGLSHEEMVRWWRAMGFAEVPEGDLAFSDDDVAMASALAALLQSGRLADRDVLRLARVLGASFSRIAEAQVDLFDHHAPSPGDDVGHEAASAPADAAITVDPSLLATFEASLIYVWRRHLLAALGRRVQLGPITDPPPPSRDDAGADVEGMIEDPEAVAADDHSAGAVTVGFVDISGFSKMSKRLSSDDLADLVDRFEADALDVIGSHGGRVVKFIGDAAMYVATDLASGVEIGLDLQERGTAADPPVDLHCGVAHGPGVTMGGDVFGPTVNLASRLTDLARRGTVVIPRECAEELAGVHDLLVRPVRRSYDLKGIGRTRVSIVAYAPDEAPDADGNADPRERDRSDRRERRERERAERRERKEREREAREQEREDREHEEGAREEGASERPERDADVAGTPGLDDAHLDPDTADGPDSS